MKALGSIDDKEGGMQMEGGISRTNRCNSSIVGSIIIISSSGNGNSSRISGSQLKFGVWYTAHLQINLVF